MDICRGDLFSRDLDIWDLEHRRKIWVRETDWGTLPRENMLILETHRAQHRALGNHTTLKACQTEGEWGAHRSN